MVTLKVHKDFQAVRHFPFCYLCGQPITKGVPKNRDHVPPQAVFSVRDREPALTLSTHPACNHSWSAEDRKLAQLIALRRFEAPKSARDFALKVDPPDRLGTAVTNLDIEGAVFRWVRGFHAALYREPLAVTAYSLVTPFPRADTSGGTRRVKKIREQDYLAVKLVRYNRAAGAVDQVVSNRQQLQYECTWVESNVPGAFACFFALNIYDWKDRGAVSAEAPARGCAGMYTLPGFTRPAAATVGKHSDIVLPGGDPLDAFA